ncbi:MAG: CBS domain-containing protein [Candidatus Omnitrophica bacterium]|nr:CBS domain-containing protein [Candidatus Omnitrophota bacterium]
MAYPVRVIDAYAPFSQVEEMMRIYASRHLPVVSGDGRLIGLITQRDLYRVAPPKINDEGARFYIKEDLDEYILRHVMTKNPFALRPEDSLADGLTAMVKHRYGCVPIVDSAYHLAGIITQSDIVRRAAAIVRG